MNLNQCPDCQALFWSPLALHHHNIAEHWLPELKMDVIGGRRSDWICQAPTHAQAMLLADYRAVISWQDEIRYILDEHYGLGGQAA